MILDQMVKSEIVFWLIDDLSHYRFSIYERFCNRREHVINGYFIILKNNMHLLNNSDNIIIC